MRSDIIVLQLYH